MKYRPSLLKKLTMQDKHGYREVIGLIGTHHGTGVTYTGLMMAFYMEEELGKKTAYLECNRHGDMRLIQQSYEWNNETKDTFSYRRITCYREIEPEQIAGIMGENYGCIIMDFGIDFAGCKDEFLRCTRKIIVGGCSEWDRRKLHKFTETTRSVPGSETWQYLIPRADEQSMLHIRREMKRKIVSVPEEMEPTRLKRKSRMFFQELFRIK